MLENTDQLASMLWGMLKTRLALASLELNEARHRFVRLLLLSVFTVISGLVFDYSHCFLGSFSTEVLFA